MELSADAIGSVRVVLIAGPTASGKSAAALALAEVLELRGEKAWIVNADAMQVYEGLRILTARPDEAAEARVPHRLYGHVSPAIRYSVGAWLDDIAAVLGDAEGAGARTLIVGGTGLYFKALTEGLADIPDIPIEVRAKWAEHFQQEGAGSLHKLLGERDPAAASVIRPTDPQRILRALEVLDVTGLTFDRWRQKSVPPPLVRLAGTPAFVVEVDRKILHRRIEERFDGMVREGALKEVRALLERGLDPHLPSMKAIGVREFSSALRGEVPLDAAIAKAKQETRRYAKRQATWFRHQMPGWRRVSI